MTNQVNKDAVKKLREKVAKAKSIVVTDYTGLDANNVNALRENMRKNNSEVTVAKNTLIKLAMKEENIDVSPLENDLQGQTAVIFSYNDAVSSIKALFEFIKKVELPKVKSAIFDGKYSNAKEVEVISTLPSKEQLIAQILGGLKSPMNGIVRTLSGVQGKFVRVLSEVSKKKTA